MKAPTLNDLTDAICAYVAEHGGADEVKCRIALAALVGAIWNCSRHMARTARREDSRRLPPRAARHRAG